MNRDRIIIASSFVVSIVICILIEIISGPAIYDRHEAVEIAKTSLGVWATLLGFIVTAESILITMGGNEYIEAFRNSHHYKTVIFAFFLAKLDLFMATAFGAFVICSKGWNDFLSCVLLFFNLSAPMLIFFCLYFFQFMVRKSTGGGQAR